MISDHAAIVSQFEWWFRGGADSAITRQFHEPRILDLDASGIAVT